MTPPSTSPPIRLATAAMVRDGCLLIVRKKGTESFIQPGGKIEPGETPLAALARELNEELGITIDPSHAEWLGAFTSPSAHQPDRTVLADCFLIAWDQPVTIHAELEEYRWLAIAPEPDIAVAPLILQEILPRLRAR